jgi:hypothetical protein
MVVRDTTECVVHQQGASVPNMVPQFALLRSSCTDSFKDDRLQLQICDQVYDRTEIVEK